jgi:hypothetical protein
MLDFANMLDISSQHPFEACTAFAISLLERLSRYDLSAVEALIDKNDSGAPLTTWFPSPDGFTYCHPDFVRNWTMHICAADENGLQLSFDLPFKEKKYRPMDARFVLRRVENQLEVCLEGIVPS